MQLSSIIQRDARRVLQLGFFCSLLLLPQVGQADSVYAVKGPRGSITFTTRKPAAGRDYRVIATAKPRKSRFVYRSSGYFARAVPSQFDELIRDVASGHGLEPALVKAVVHVESAFRPQATSHKGAMGLMQLMPGTAQRFGVYNAYKPEENLRGGTTYLRNLLERYQGNMSLALAAYNAGEGAVDKYGTIPPYRETREYVSRVTSVLQLYRCDFNGQRQC